MSYLSDVFLPHLFVFYSDKILFCLQNYLQYLIILTNSCLPPFIVNFTLIVFRISFLISLSLSFLWRCWMQKKEFNDKNQFIRSVFTVLNENLNAVCHISKFFLISTDFHGQCTLPLVCKLSLCNSCVYLHFLDPWDCSVKETWDSQL